LIKSQYKEQLKCSKSMHFHSEFHYLYTITDGLVNYVKASAFKAKAGQSHGHARPRNLALKPRPRINIPVYSYCQMFNAACCGVNICLSLLTYLLTHLAAINSASAAFILTVSCRELVIEPCTHAPRRHVHIHSAYSSADPHS